MKEKTSALERFVIIMAGGKGERFWPVSRDKSPKQLLKLLGDKSFLLGTNGNTRSMVCCKNDLSPNC